MATDRILRSGIEETTMSIGPGTLDLEGNSVGWHRFRTLHDDGDYPVYVRRNANGTKQQLVRGQLTYGTGAGGRDQLSVLTVIASTDGGATPTAIDWTAADNPCAVFPAPAEELLDWAISRYGTLPSWLIRGLRVDPGAGATARKLYWRDGAGDIELANIDETNNRVRFRERKGANIASAASIDLGAATGSWVDITGTTGISALGTADEGDEILVRFLGALVLTYNATTLILPWGTDIKTAAGDFALFRSLGSGNWICVEYLTAVPQDRVLAAGAFTGADHIYDGFPAWAHNIEATYDIVPNNDGVTVEILMRKGSGTDINLYSGSLHVANGSSVTNSAQSAQTSMAVASPVQFDANVGGVSISVKVRNIKSGRHKRARVEAEMFDGTNILVASESWIISDTADLTGIKVSCSGGINTTGSRYKIEAGP